MHSSTPAGQAITTVVTNKRDWASNLMSSGSTQKSSSQKVPNSSARTSSRNTNINIYVPTNTFSNSHPLP